MLVREYASTLRGREREAQSAFHRLDASQGSTLTFFRKLAIIHSSLSYRLGGIVPSLSCAKRRQADDKTGLLMNDICHLIHLPPTTLPPCLPYEYPPSALSLSPRDPSSHTLDLYLVKVFGLRGGLHTLLIVRACSTLTVGRVQAKCRDQPVTSTWSLATNDWKSNETWCWKRAYLQR